MKIDRREENRRRDIDGLRAVAILAVLGFHTIPALFAGGFIGVDVFFAISGYLITRILLTSLEEGSFAFGNFYARRIRRIFPALAVVLAASFALGWLLLPPAEFRQLGKDILAGAAFVSNLVFWNETGYFGASAVHNVLLHLWSLGIEEQFYILWPLMLWAAWRWRLAAFWPILSVSVLSFIANLYLTHTDPAAAFYSPLSRAWELGVGSLLACVSLPGRRRAFSAPVWFDTLISIMGISAILAGIALLNQNDEFPGWRALLPVAGAALIIRAGPNAMINRRLLSAPPMVWIGLISYPLYLWHWVLLSFLWNLQGSGAGWQSISLAVLLSVVLAALTYYGLEKPIRAGNWSLGRLGGVCAALAVLAVMGAAAYRYDGFSFRYPAEVRPLLTYNFDYDFRSDSRVFTCWISRTDPVEGYASFCLPEPGPSTKPKLFIWGDSHAGRLYPGFAQVYGKEYNIYSATRDSCPPLFSLAYELCLKSNHYIFSVVEKAKPNLVILFASWPIYLHADHGSFPGLKSLSEITDALAAAGVKKIIVVGPAPRWADALPLIMYREWENQLPPPHRQDRLKTNLEREAFAIDAAMRAHEWNKRVIYFSMIDALCNERGCLTYVPGADSDFTTWDYGHLTTPGAVFVVKAMNLTPGNP
jgi:peptidoglycan/LPS O-acetylase OafA/YrhL